MRLTQIRVESALLKHFLRHRGSQGSKTRQASRPDAGRLETSLRLSFTVDPRLFEDKQVVHAEVVTFHAGYFGNLDDLARPAHEPAHLHDNVNG